MKKRFILLATIISTILCPKINACKCEVVRDELKQFCQSDFVAKVNVKDDGVIQTDERLHENKIYNVQYLQVFKGCDMLMETVNKNNLTTPRYGASCGMNLEKGKDYLIEGIIRSKKPWTFKCGLNTEWNLLNNKTKEKLLGKKFNKCANSTCPDGLPYSTASTLKCYFLPFFIFSTVIVIKQGIF